MLVNSWQNKSEDEDKECKVLWVRKVVKGLNQPHPERTNSAHNTSCKRNECQIDDAQKTATGHIYVYKLSHVE